VYEKGQLFLRLNYSPPSRAHLKWEDKRREGRTEGEEGEGKARPLDPQAPIFNGYIGLEKRGPLKKGYPGHTKSRIGKNTSSAAAARKAHRKKKTELLKGPSQQKRISPMSGITKRREARYCVSRCRAHLGFVSRRS